MTKGRVVWGVLAILVVLPTADVSVGKAAPLTVQSKRDLRFGDVLPGVPLTLAYTDGNAGNWRLKGNKNAEIQVTFVLPAAT